MAQRAEARPGNATLLKLRYLFPGADIYAKSEWLNPAGSAITGAAEFDRARSSADWAWMVWDIPVVWQWQGLEGALPPQSQLFSHVVPPSPAVDRSGRLRGCAAPARRRCTSSPCRCTSPARCCPGCLNYSSFPSAPSVFEMSSTGVDQITSSTSGSVIEKEFPIQFMNATVFL